MKISEQQQKQIEQAESGLMNFCYAIFALLVIIWLCNDNVNQITSAVHHEPQGVNVLHSLGLI